MASDAFDQELHTSTATVVAHARRREDGRSVIIRKARGTASDILPVLGHEYEILEELDIPDVVQAIALDVVDAQEALIVEDGGEPVGAFRRQTPAEISDLLKTALSAIDQPWIERIDA